MASLATPHRAMRDKIQRMSNDQLQTVWAALDQPEAWSHPFYSEGIPLQDWAIEIYSELSHRGLPTV